MLSLSLELLPKQSGVDAAVRCCRLLALLCWRSHSVDHYVVHVCSKLRLNAETQNGYKWPVDRPGTGDQAEHRKSVGPGGKRKRAESECPVKLVSHHKVT